MGPAKASVSIAMAALNSARYIAEALRSIAAGAAPGIDIEAVLADGGSRDNTLQLARDVAAECGFVLRVLPGPDRGIYHGMNRAIAASRGEFVIILNSDDRLAKGALPHLLQAAGDCDVTTGSVRRFGSASGGAVWCNRHPMSVRSILFGIPAVNARLFRRDFLRSIDPFREDLGLAADREFLLRVLAATENRCTAPAVVFEYREHPGSQTIGGTLAARLRVHQAHEQLTASCLGEASRRSKEIRALTELQAATHLKLALLARAAGHSAQPLSTRARCLLEARSAALSGPVAALAWRRRGSGW